MSGIIYYVIDTETTGLGEMHDVIELSIVRHPDKVQFSRTIKADHPRNANFDALRITGKTMNDLYKGENRKDVVMEANAFFESDGATPNHRCIVGHNIISFDKRFLHRMWEKSDSIFPANMWLDTIHLMKQYIKKNGIQSKKFNLEYSLDLIKIGSVGAAHTAKGDARNTYLLWQALVERENIDYVELIKRFSHAPEGAEEENEDDKL